MKVNAKQQDVLDKMANGWQLGYPTGVYSPGWYDLQKGGQGRGGETMRIHGNTITALEKRGLIKQIYGFPTSKYILVKGVSNGSK